MCCVEKAHVNLTNANLKYVLSLYIGFVQFNYMSWFLKYNTLKHQTYFVDIL